MQEIEYNKNSRVRTFTGTSDDEDDLSESVNEFLRTLNGKVTKLETIVTQQNVAMDGTHNGCSKTGSTVITHVIYYNIGMKNNEL